MFLIYPSLSNEEVSKQVLGYKTCFVVNYAGKIKPELSAQYCTRISLDPVVKAGSVCCQVKKYSQNA